MPDLKWRVRVERGTGESVERWVWDYAFSHKGTVTWRDPFNGKHGSGSWRMDETVMTIRWNGSTSWEEWDVPMFPQHATGEVHWSDGSYPLEAVATDWYYRPGDVAYGVGEPIKRGNGTVACVIYPDEVRTGGTVAWITRNPGNIREGEKYGAYKGKKLYVNKVGGYAIFPDAATGLLAMVKVLRAYGALTIRQAIYKYAPEKDGNDPAAYLATVIRGTKFSESSILTSMSDEQLQRMADVMSGEVERTQEGTPWARDSYDLPPGLRPRLATSGQ
jgi:hypothetical protein